MDSYNYIHNPQPGWRFCAAQNYRQLEDDWMDNVSVKQIDPTYNYGYQAAVEPKGMEPGMGNRTKANCTALVELAFDELDSEFTTNDVCQLLEGSGWSKATVRQRISLVANRRNYTTTGRGKGNLTVYHKP